MAFDNTTRARLQRFVSEARSLLMDEFSKQFQQDYGLDPDSGGVAELESLTHLDDRRLETARILREILSHYLASDMGQGIEGRKRALDRMVREQAFTTLNRLVALRMMEARGLVMECVVKGYQSKAFQLYQRVAGTPLGETGDVYRTFLLSMCDLYSADLPGLFDRHFPNGRLFPREPALLPLLELINAADIDALWAEDETIGWIYQYFNSREERKAMREVSQAPRNSRELAVRNQFFTPRYVVEFLVDNTLGRLWFNWTGGQTSLRDHCQYLLVQPDDKPGPTRRLRDPRTIKLLDPACGSMHFGLYAFDLFLEIYREAWAWEQTHGPGSLDTETGGSPDLRPLCRSYADEDAFLRDVPRLIIEHNVYGVDIDPRAAQIASLALWLRAQRTWHEMGVKAQERPQVGRGHVVAAVAPPAEVELRKRFMEELDRLDAELFEKTLFLLKGLPELGALLQVEKEIPRLIRKVFGEHGDLFKGEDMAQWQKAEIRLREALTKFASAAQSTYQGRLFAQDALQGLRIIDLSREIFDVVVMNPPFGALGEGFKHYLEDQYPESKNDLLMIFVERSIEMLRSNGQVGAITSRNCFLQSNGQKWREDVVLKRAGPVVVADLGFGVMDDAQVEAAAYCLEKGFFGNSVWYRLVRSEKKAEDLLSGREAFHVEDASFFEALPMKPFAYWIPKSIHKLFEETDAFESAGRQARCGMGTLDDFRFVRAWWEVVNLNEWTPYAKGELSPFVTDINTVVNFRASGRELKSYVEAKVGSASRKVQSEAFYFRKGLQYGRRMRNPSPAVLPPGCIFSDSANALFIAGDNDRDLAAYLALLNSSLVKAILTSIAPVRKMEVGFVQRFPIPYVSQEDDDLVKLAEREIKKAGRKLMRLETSRYFAFPGIVFDNCVEETGDESVCALFEVEERDIEFLVRQSQISIRTANNFDEASIGPEGDTSESIEIDSADPNEEQEDGSVTTVDQTDALLSWAVGVAFGRFDYRLATDERGATPEPYPFDPLPAISPGMLPEGAEPFHRYPGILVDDPSNPHDLARLVEEVLIRIAASVPSDVRRWLQRDFFSFHLQYYSKSRRKAPIYWPLSTTSGSYTLWLYYPSMTSQTLYTAVNDFIEGPSGKLRQVEQEASALRIKGWARSREDDRRLEALQTLESELIILRDTLLQIAPTYRPNHDDGVQITAAPLWPLFRHKPWQKVLKDTWSKLEKGDYDWAYLPMAYWPDRVRDKCKTDKSLAIAHDLEHLYVEPESKPAGVRGRKKKADA